MEIDEPRPGSLPPTSTTLAAVAEEPAQESDPAASVSNADSAMMNGSGLGESSEADQQAALTLASVAGPPQHHQPYPAAESNMLPPSDMPLVQPALANRPLPATYNKDQPICYNCATQTTPLWRRSHDSTHILCNACALFFKMKGRPRPISLKTDVIKSRNRSKGKSSSKDRSNGSGKASSHRSESTSRSREEGVVGQKSAPGGAPEEDFDMLEPRSKPFGEGAIDSESSGRKARKMSQPSPYGMMPMPGYGPPGYGYPYPYPYGAPPGHQPYPIPPRSRSQSAEGRRAQSLDSRSRADGHRLSPANGYGYPPPPGAGYPHPGAPGIASEGFYAPFAGYPPGAYAPHPPFYPSPYPPAPGQHAHALQAPTIAHAQSDSRSRSPATAPPSEAGTNSRHASASPPPSNSAGQTYPSNLNGAYHLHQPHTHSPLGAIANQAVPGVVNGRAGSRAAGLTLAPMVGSTSRADSPQSHHSNTSTIQGHSADHKVHLPSINAVNHDATAAHQRLSRSSHSPSASGSSDGIRSPEPAPRGRASLPREDERRGRPETRFEQSLISDDHVARSDSGHRLVGVETGLGELRVADGSLYGGSPKSTAAVSLLGEEDSRSRSSGRHNGRGGEERGRSRAPGMHAGRSGSTSRAGRTHAGIEGGRGSSSSSTSSRHYHSLVAAEAEIARLNSKVAELKFLNGLMQSRLAVLEQPGKVPARAVDSLTAETPRPEYDDMDDQVEEDEELERYGVTVAGHDPDQRRKLLQFLRSQ